MYKADLHKAWESFARARVRFHRALIQDIRDRGGEPPEELVTSVKPDSTTIYSFVEKCPRTLRFCNLDKNGKCRFCGFTQAELRKFRKPDTVEKGQGS